MIIMGLATYVDRIAETPVETCSCFFNEETAGQAGQELALNYDYDDIGYTDVEFTYIMVQALFSEAFLWNDDFTPRNFSTFCLIEG